jgi:D-alanine transfer protein
MPGQNQPLSQTPHLAPALAAVILGAVALEAFGFYARSLEHRSITALAADETVIDRDARLVPVKNQGSALQQAALDTGGLLLVFGSSELNVQAAYNRPFHATNLFRDRPGGFTIFPVGKAGTTCLIMLQKLAALGPTLEGRKVVVSVSPFWFFERLTARADAYAGNFSDLHAGELAFHTRLSLELRQDAARRMLQFPATIANRPLLRFALENLADGSAQSLTRYDAVLPLGILHNAILHHQDHWNVVRYLWTNPPRSSAAIAPSGEHPLDWPMLHLQAESASYVHSCNNEFGMDNALWDKELREETIRLKNARSDQVFLSMLERNQEWIDLELLLRGLNELGAQSLVMSMPIHGRWYDYCGITYKARRAYYEKLRTTSARHHIPVVDFADHDADETFCHDKMGHLSPSGLVYYNEVTDWFFHGVLPRQAELAAAIRPSRGDKSP